MNIERKIVIGFIVSKSFLQKVRPIFKPEYLGSKSARTIAKWCVEYFDKYGKAPKLQMETIYTDKSRKKNLDKDAAAGIETILNGLSKEFVKKKFKTKFIYDKTVTYFNERNLEILKDNIEGALENDDTEKALEFIDKFQSVEQTEKDESTLDLSSKELLDKIDLAFDQEYQNVISYPGALGDFWNDQLVRGAFVSLLAPEKRGKTFWLMDMMVRAYRQNKKVAFFQAGDMTETQQIMRICVHLAGKSNLEKFCGNHYVPVQDCVYNQIDQCDRKIRSCDFGVFENETIESLRNEMTKEKLVEAYKDNKDYKNCYNCVPWQTKKWGVPWLEKITIDNPLTAKQAKKTAKKFFIDTMRSIKLSTHANGTLTLKKMNNILDGWKDEGFEPEVILCDYAELLLESGYGEHRHQHDKLWKGLRGMSQERDCLLVVPTQADAKSYLQNTLTLENYSEDKRKFGHVTAMYGLNQDKDGREKDIGIMRINKIVIREDSFHSSHQVFVIYKFEIGKPYLGSYY